LSECAETSLSELQAELVSLYGLATHSRLDQHDVTTGHTGHKCFVEAKANKGRGVNLHELITILLINHYSNHRPYILSI